MPKCEGAPVRQLGAVNGNQGPRLTLTCWSGSSSSAATLDQGSCAVICCFTCRQSSGGGGWQVRREAR